MKISIKKQTVLKRGQKKAKRIRPEKAKLCGITIPFPHRNISITKI